MNLQLWTYVVYRSINYGNCGSAFLCLRNSESALESIYKWCHYTLLKWHISQRDTWATPTPRSVTNKGTKNTRFLSLVADRWMHSDRRGKIVFPVFVRPWLFWIQPIVFALWPQKVCSKLPFCGFCYLKYLCRPYQHIKFVNFMNIKQEFTRMGAKMFDFWCFGIQKSPDMALQTWNPSQHRSPLPCQIWQ